MNGELRQPAPALRIPITRQMLVEWAGERVVHDAELLVQKGVVVEANYEPPLIQGTLLYNNRLLKTALRICDDRTVESRCPCRDNTERFIICAHVIALGLVLVKRATDPLRDQKYRDELRRASRLAVLDEAAYVRRVPADSPGAVPAQVRVSLDADWQAQFARGMVNLACEVCADGSALALDAAPRDIPYTFCRADESLLYVLEDISEGPARGSLQVSRVDFLNVIRLLAGRRMPVRGGAPVTVNDVRMTMLLRMELDNETGELNLMGHTELPYMQAGAQPLHLVAGNAGWAYGADNLWPLEKVLPAPYHAIYEGRVTVPRGDVIRFMQRELPALAKDARIESDISMDLFTVEPGAPRFRLMVKGSPAALSFTLLANYGARELVAGKPASDGEFAVPDPEDLLRYTVRNPAAEQKALERLRRAGITGETGDSLSHVVGCREVLNFLGGHVPRLRRAGWEVMLEGRVSPYMDTVDYVTPVVRVADGAGGAAGGGMNWFEVSFAYEDAGGQSISPADVQRAMLKGDSYVERNGRTVLVDSDAVESMLSILADCATREADRPGAFRVSGIHSGFLKSSLDALDGVDVEVSAEWRSRAGRLNRSLQVEAEPIGERLEGVLRPYQKDGVHWLRFLETNGFCGILADEMGLGKTVMTLAWLGLARRDPRGQGRPALIVCPTSLVENWAEEAARFVPGTKVLLLTGADRHGKWEDVPRADLVVTSYALLRRDGERHLEQEFSAVVLDEAQHIKNRSTRNAVMAKQLRCGCRLVLTGTPVENSVSDLWSIMDFLMPGYLGPHDAFRERYELPISRGGPEAEVAQLRLRRKLHPFLLRRLKREVIQELPPKIEKVTSCSLTADQRVVYTEILAASQRKIRDMVAQQGFSRSRMEILTALMRMRQACCHLDLLKLPGLKSEAPSAKMELFFELLDEALDGGHRVLVFSQFVSMLHILRGALDQRGIAYCYLDGATKDRLAVVHRFNTQREIPLFLISLKAGGTGLNLTGADMVIHFDPWWNPAVEDQATDRAHRIGQKRTVYSLKLITKGTVEEKVLALQQRKADIMHGTIESDEKMVQSLTWGDVQELLSL